VNSTVSTVASETFLLKLFSTKVANNWNDIFGKLDCSKLAARAVGTSPIKHIIAIKVTR
jgi:hypothetical protein